MRLPAGLTDAVLVRLWHGSEPIAAICDAWRVPTHHIYWHWSRLRKEKKLPEYRRGHSPSETQAVDEALEEDMNVADAPCYLAARLDCDPLLDRLIRFHGPLGRPDLKEGG